MDETDTIGDPFRIYGVDIRTDAASFGLFPAIDSGVVKTLAESLCRIGSGNGRTPPTVTEQLPNLRSITVGYQLLRLPLVSNRAPATFPLPDADPDRDGVPDPPAQ